MKGHPGTPGTGKGHGPGKRIPRCWRHLETQGAGNLETEQESPKKERERERSVVRTGNWGSLPGARTRNRCRPSCPGTLRGRAPRPTPHATCAAARRAAQALPAGASAHNEALSDVAAVPEQAGGSRGGREGRKEPVGPRLQIPSPPPAEGPRLGGGAAVQGRAPRKARGSRPGAARGARFGYGCERVLAVTPHPNN